jgi:hypothetical protein
MSKNMEFSGIHKGNTIEVSGPDKDGEYRITVNKLQDEYSYIYVSRATLAEMHAFIGELLAGEGVA